MDALDCLKTRRSVRQFTSEEIDKTILEDIVDCGHLAASAINIQPVHFVVVTDSELKLKLANTTDHGKFLAHAPACIVVLSENVKYYLEDGSAATQNILLAAKAYGLGSCWIAGDKKEYADTIVNMLGAPSSTKLISLIAIGKPASIQSPAKKSVSEVIHWNRY